ncbi:MAG: FIST N-terminal domain-containing protein [Promethearchaeota archaeon]
MLDAGVGISIKKDGYEAGRNAAKQALENMNTKPKLAILAVDSLSRRKFNYNKILQGIREELGPDVILIGSTANGIIVNDRFALRSVGLMLIGGDLSIDASFNEPKSRLEYEKIAEIIYQKSISLEPKDNRFLLMFQDGAKFPPKMLAKQKMLNSRVVALMSGIVRRFFKKVLDDMEENGMGMPSLQKLLETLYSKGWTYPVIGNISTDLRDYDSVEFFNDTVGTDNVVGTILSGFGNTKFGFGFSAGAESTGKTCTITKNIGNMILKIDGNPAILGFCDAAGLNKEALYELKSAGNVNYYNMFGTREIQGNNSIIHLTGTITNPDLENLVMTGYPFDRVPKKVEIFQSNMDVMHKTARECVNQALSGIAEPKFLLGFDCAMRFFAYGDNLSKIIKTINDEIGKDIPKMIFGAGGEIFANKDIDLYENNITFITLAGGE